MESLFRLPVASGATIRVLQITDTHLFSNVEETLLSMNTHKSYHAVLDAILSQNQNYDLIVATGDLAQDHSLQAYQHFADGVSRLSAPCVWLPGNHDFQPAMVNALADAGIAQSKQILLGDNWHILLLDSQVLGAAYGALSDYQLEWLDRCLNQYSQRHTLVLLHHHPVSSGCNWLDQHRLRNSHMLEEVLARHPQVKIVLCGHIHQEMDLDWRGKRVLATPSTCVQFKPHCTNFRLDSLAPGWRVLELMPDGTVDTKIERLNNNNDFQPDMDSEGYS